MEILELVAAQSLLDVGIVQRGDRFWGDGLVAHGAVIQMHMFGEAIIDAQKAVAVADGPVHGHRLHPQHRFDLVQQAQRVFGRPVHFVDKGKNGNPALAADLEQLACLCFHTTSGIQHHDGTVHGR